MVLKLKKSRDFKTFQAEFTRRQKQFGLLGYKVYFKYEPLEDAFAEIRWDRHADMAATVALNSKLGEKDKPFKNPRRQAKHEALHLLIMRLESCSRRRFVGEEEIYGAAEELVRRLDSLIP